jgi:hypothetical protein
MSNTKNTNTNKLPNIDYMWWKLPLVKNTTNMIKGKWCDNRNKNITGNHAVITGEDNNITGLDLDFSYKLSDEELNSNPITKKFIDLFGKEPTWDTYTVRTRSGGLHYYFEYEPEIKQTQDDDTKIDIRGKGGCLYGAGTIVSKGDKQGEYKCINNKKQMKMPEELKSFLLENLYTKKPSKQTIQKKDAKITKKQNKKMYDESYYEYDFSDDLLRRIFDGLPHEYWRCVVAQDGNPSFLTWTAACKSLDCEELWDEYNQKFDGYDYDKNVTLWNSANESYNCFQNLLKHTSFPNADKLIDYHKYQPILENEIEPNIEFESEKLGYDYFKQGSNIIVKSDTGTGKTTSFQKYIENTNEKFISITSRVSLANDQYERFSKEINNVFYYKDLTNDVKGNLLGLSKKNQYDKFVFKGSVVVEIESLINRLEYAESITNLNEMVVYLDEFNSLIQHIHTSSTLENTLTFILDQFIYILKNCKQIIMTDADISDTSILWFKENIGREFEFHKNNHKHNKNVKAQEILSYDTLVDKLHKNKKWLVPCDSRQNALTLHEQFPDAKLIVAETTEIPNLDDHDRVIFSPKIVYGVDSTMERPVFCFFQERTIDPSQMVQMTCRCRNISKLYYLFMRKSFKPKDIDFSKLWDEMIQQHSMSLKYFQNRYFEHLEKGYLNTLHRIHYDKKCYSSNPYAHFKRLIKERGIEDIDLYKNTYSASFQTEKKELKEKTLQEKIDSFDITNEEYSKINKILKLDKNNADEFKMFFIDDNLLHRHWNISTMFFQKDIDIKFDNFDYFSENFTTNKITKEKTKLKLLQDMKIECGCLDPYDITPKKIFDKNLLEDYKIIFRNRSKNLKADTIYDCQKIIVGMYKKLFGDIIDSKRKKIDGKCKYNYSINNDSIILDKKLFEIRKNISDKVKFVEDSEKENESIIFDLDI